MKEDVEKLKEEVVKFCEKYNVSIYINGGITKRFGYI